MMVLSARGLQNASPGSGLTLLWYEGGTSLAEMGGTYSVPVDENRGISFTSFREILKIDLGGVITK